MTNKIYPVLDASSAISDHNKKVSKIAEIQSRVRKRDNNLVPVDQSDQPSLEEYMMTQGIPVSYSTKSALAKKMGMSNYNGSSQHDKMILSAMSNKDKSKNEKEVHEKESSFKDRELSIKEKSLESNKMPTAEEVAEALLGKIK